MTSSILSNYNKFHFNFIESHKPTENFFETASSLSILKNMNYIAPQDTNRPMTLFDAKPFLEKMFEILLYKDPNAQTVHFLQSQRNQLHDYFRRTHQGEGFLEIEVSARREALYKLIDQPRFLQLLKRDLFQQICLESVKDIENKFTHWPSIHGHSRDLIGLKDRALLHALIQHFPKDSFVHERARKIEERVTNELSKAAIKLQQYSIFFDALTENPLFERDPSTLSPQELDLLLRAKESMLEIDLSLGRNFERELLADVEPKLRLLFAVDSMRGERIDEAQLLAWIKEHNEARIHPKVVLAGGGPTGLLAALTQYQAGADVSLFEKRDMLYDRTQIVRLDPKWMDMLRFYLGEAYYQLFHDTGHRGIVRSDEFGEIALFYLEDALHMRLTELISMDNKGIDRKAAHELVDIVPPKEPNGRYAVVAHSSDSSPLLQEADLLVITSGKKSPLREKFLGSSVPVTNEEYYGVCSWLSPVIPNQHPDSLDLFQDFRGMLDLNASFFQRFRDRFDAWVDLTIRDPTLQNSFHQITHSPEFDRLIASDFSQSHVQTRTFENRGLIYIGMEIPREVRQWVFEECNQGKEALQVLKQSWFQTVMESYGLDQTHGLTLDKMDKKFAATFPVDQIRLDKEHAMSLFQNNQSQLLITTAGDARCSPHFMRYSGLTGGRENILDLQLYMRRKVEGYDESSNLQMLKNHSDLADEFVVSRGVAFLKRKTAEEISDLRTKKMKQLLDEAANQESGLLHKSNSSYWLELNDLVYKITPRAGYLEMNSKTYESLHQIFLSMPHSNASTLVG